MSWQRFERSHQFYFQAIGGGGGGEAAALVTKTTTNRTRTGHSGGVSVWPRSAPVYSFSPSCGRFRLIFVCSFGAVVGRLLPLSQFASFIPGSWPGGVLVQHASRADPAAPKIRPDSRKHDRRRASDGNGPVTRCPNASEPAQTTNAPHSAPIKPHHPENTHQPSQRETGQHELSEYPAASKSPRIRKYYSLLGAAMARG